MYKRYMLLVKASLGLAFLSLIVAVGYLEATEAGYNEELAAINEKLDLIRSVCVKIEDKDGASRNRVLFRKLHPSGSAWDKKCNGENYNSEHTRIAREMGRLGAPRSSWYTVKDRSAFSLLVLIPLAAVSALIHWVYMGRYERHGDED